MKIRNGFVSNSSSSSFIVKVYETSFETKCKKRLITKAQENLLVRRKWKYTIANPSSLLVTTEKNNGEIPLFDPKKEWDLFGLNLGYYVEVNQDDVIEWLVKKGIPFQASCHYGTYSVFFDGKKCHELKNHGIEAELYGLEYVERMNSIRLKK